MKNFLKTSLLFFFLCNISVATGQSAIGGKLGFTLSTLKGDIGRFASDESKRINFGWQFGAIFEIEMDNRLSFQPELIFIQKGIDSKFSTIRSEGQVDSESFTNINFIEIPILLKVKYGNKDRINFFFTAGPSIGYIINSKLTRIRTVEELTTKTSFDFIRINTDQFKRFDTSISLGAGVNYPIGPGKFFAEARYLFGITNLIKVGRLGGPDNLRNRGIGLSTGYLVSIGKNKNSKI